MDRFRWNFMRWQLRGYTNWLRFEPNPLTRLRIPAGTRFTPDFWILAGYLKLWTDFDEILWVDSCGVLHDLVRFWAGSGSESGSWIRTCIQNRKVDSAKGNGRISRKFYEWIACESRKRLISGAIRIIFWMRYPYPEFTQIIDYGGFWRNLVQRWRLRQGRAE